MRPDQSSGPAIRETSASSVWVGTAPTASICESPHERIPRTPAPDSPPSPSLDLAQSGTPGPLHPIGPSGSRGHVFATVHGHLVCHPFQRLETALSARADAPEIHEDRASALHSSSGRAGGTKSPVEGGAALPGPAERGGRAEPARCTTRSPRAVRSQARARRVWIVPDPHLAAARWRCASHEGRLVLQCRSDGLRIALIFALFTVRGVVSGSFPEAHGSSSPPCARRCCG